MTKSAINILEDNNYTLITTYLEDTYVIKNNTFVNKHTDTSYWGWQIVEDLEQIMSLKEDFILEIMKCWVVFKGMDIGKWDNAYKLKTLNSIYEPDKVLALQRIIGVNAEKQIVAILSEQIAKEIDEEILRMLKKKLTTFGEFENLLLCLGYRVTERRQPINSPTHHPYHNFESTTEYDKINEQQNNPYWKDWFRARGPNQETQEPSFLEEDGHDFH